MRAIWNPIVVIFCVVVLMTTGLAQEISVESRVVAIEGDNIYVPLPENIDSVSTDTEVEVLFDAGGVRVSVGKWRVLHIEDRMAIAEPLEIEGSADVDMIALFHNAISDGRQEAEFSDNVDERKQGEPESGDETEIAKPATPEQALAKILDALPSVSFSESTELPQEIAGRAACISAQILIDDTRNRLVDGKLGEAQAILSAANISDCPELAPAYSETLSQIALQIQGIDLAGNRAITECSRVDMQAVGTLMERASVPDLQDSLIRINLNLERDQQIQDILSKADLLLTEGDLVASGSAYDVAGELLGQRRAQCPEENKRVEEGLKLAVSLSALVDTSQRALATCDENLLGEADSSIKLHLARSQAIRTLSASLADRISSIARAKELVERYSSVADIENAGMAIAEIEELLRRVANFEAQTGCDGVVLPVRDLAGKYHVQKNTADTLSGALLACEASELQAAIESTQSAVQGKSVTQDVAKLQRSVNGALLVRRAFDELSGAAPANASGISSAINHVVESGHVFSRHLATISELADGGYCPDFRQKFESRANAFGNAQSLALAFDALRNSCTIESLNTFRDALDAAAPTGTIADDLISDTKKLLDYLVSVKGTEGKIREALGGNRDLNEIETLVAQAREENGRFPASGDICTGLASEIDSLNRQVSETRALLLEAPSVLDTCNPPVLDRFIEKSASHTYGPLVNLNKRAMTARKSLEAYMKLPDLIENGDLFTVSRMFREIASKFAGKNADCQSLRETAQELATPALAAASVLEVVEDAIEACQLSDLDEYAKVIGNDLVINNLSLEDENRKLKEAIQNCEQTIRDERTLQCRSRHGAHAMSNSVRSTEIECSCETGYRMSDGLCKLPLAILREGAKQVCVQRFGSLAIPVEIRSETEFKCRCTGGSVLWQGKCRTLSGRTLVEYADRVCKETRGALSKSMAVKSATNYKCRCELPNRWDQNNKCYRPSRQEMIRLGWEDCRRAHGSRLRHVIVQENGRADCYLK